ncbi:MAG: S4 domain-containing protein [Candidatus Cloacimonadota bacterium]|nr:S4 domain-containing protein [Candidatus Cloacimonadota bacterium]
MRIDILLNKLCIVKHRSIAKKACDKGLVQINGMNVKASKSVKVGDIIRVSLYPSKLPDEIGETNEFIMEFEVTQIPEGNINKSDINNYYHLVVKNQI